jgi:hypothetical protein
MPPTKKPSGAKPRGSAPRPPKAQPFPPKFSTRGVRITGFRVEVHDFQPFVMQGEDRA